MPGKLCAYHLALAKETSHLFCWILAAVSQWHDNSLSIVFLQWKALMMCLSCGIQDPPIWQGSGMLMSWVSWAATCYQAMSGMCNPCCFSVRPVFWDVCTMALKQRKSWYALLGSHVFVNCVQHKEVQNGIVLLNQNYSQSWALLSPIDFDGRIKDTQPAWLRPALSESAGLMWDSIFPTPMFSPLLCFSDENLQQGFPNPIPQAPWVELLVQPPCCIFS